MEAKVSESEMEVEPMDSDNPAGTDEPKIDEPIGESLDFDDWVSLISRIEKVDPDNLEKINLVYNSFLSEFPLYHGYWRRFVGHKIRLCNVDEVVEVFERAVQSATYSVGVWVDYCTFSMTVFEDPSDIRRLFKRGLLYVGKDYQCHALWDQYIKFELTQQDWSCLAQVYLESLRFPTKKLHRYYENFKKLIALCDKDMEFQSNCSVDLQLESLGNDEIPKVNSDSEISSVVKELFDPSISFSRSKTLLQKYISIGKHLHQKASQWDNKISSFEANIRRNYFHFEPLDADELENWHHYLDFVEMQGDFDWVVKLYERCLIPCANYPEIWMRYVEFMESRGGREIANYALNRATQIFLKRVPEVHLFSSRFKEHQVDVIGAHSALLQYEAEAHPNFVENVVMKANMERRLGNFVTASKIFEEGIASATETKDLHHLPSLYIHFSRLKHMITDSADAARDVLMDGIKNLPNSKLLLEELINFATVNGGKWHVQVLDSVVNKAISPVSNVSCGLSKSDAEDVSSLYLKFVDLCGTIHDIRRAWNRHIRLFPHSIRRSFPVHSITNIKSLILDNMATETFIASNPKQQCRDHSPDNLVNLPLQEKESPTVDSRPAQDSPHRVPQGNQEILEDFESQEYIGAEEMVEVSEKPTKESTEINEPSPELECCKVTEKPTEDFSSECQVAEGVTEDHPKGNYINQDLSHAKTEQDMKSLSLDSYSSPDLIPSIPSHTEAPSETYGVSNIKNEPIQPDNEEESSVHSQRKDVVSDSHRTEFEAVTSSSSTIHQIPTNSAGRGNLHQMNNWGKVRRESNFEPLGHVQRKSHQQQQQHEASHQNPPPEIGGPMPVNQFQHQYQATQPQPNSWTRQNTPQQNYPSLPQSVQGVGDHVTQNSQAYSQAWQYYYYQQQLVMQQQQQYLRPSQQFLQQQSVQQYFQQPPYQQHPQFYQPQQHQNQLQNTRFENQNSSLELNGNNQLGWVPAPTVMPSQNQVATSHASGTTIGSLTAPQPSPGRQ